jgi:superfamily II DNA/RNA helicase
MDLRIVAPPRAPSESCRVSDPLANQGWLRFTANTFVTELKLRKGIILSFSSFALDERLLKAVEACGFTQPSDIQQQAIPLAIEGRDLMASAPTGTGKTAAFVLPTLQRLLSEKPDKGNGPRVLVLTPTRELAKQVDDNIYKLTKFARMASCSIVGGMPYPPQIKNLKNRLDFLVATPGRLMDHIEAGRVDFSRIKLLILDEADRMLDMGFIDDVKRIAAMLPENRQTLLFSATLEGEIASVAKQLLKNPARVQVAGVQTKHESITQQMLHADDFRHKRALLAHVLDQDDVRQVIIFTATKKGAEELAEKLEADGHSCGALHGDMRQGMRRRTVESLQRGKMKVLVATDVAARGLDIRGITHVVNFDMPRQPEDYVHRIGRTGRGGATGTAISIVGPQDRMQLSRIEKLLGTHLSVKEIPGLEPKTKPQESSRGGYRNNNSNGGKRPANVRFKKKPMHGNASGSTFKSNNYGKKRKQAAEAA